MPRRINRFFSKYSYFRLALYFIATIFLLRVLIFALENWETLVIASLTAWFIYALYKNDSHTKLKRANPEVKSFVATYSEHTHIWPKLNVTIEPKDVAAFGKILEQKGIRVPEKHLLNHVHDAFVNHQISQFYDTFSRINPGIINTSSHLDWVSAYVNTFSNATDYIPLAAKAASKSGLHVTDDELKNQVLAEIERRSQQSRINKIKQAMKTGKPTSTSITIDQIDNMTGIEFEKFLKKLFTLKGYNVEETRVSGDQGADLILEKFGERTAVQAKCYAYRVPNSAIQEVVASTALYKCHKAKAITNNYFTKSAKSLAKANSVELWEREKLTEEIGTYFGA